MNLFAEFLDWLLALPPDFAFLLSLPFAVGAAGLLADRARRRAKAAPPARGARAAPARAASRDAMHPG